MHNTNAYIDCLIKRKYRIPFIHQDILTSMSSRLFFSSPTESSCGEVYIKCPNSPDEWLYIEIQGELQSTTKPAHNKSSVPDEELRHLWNQPLGEFKDEGVSWTFMHYILSYTLLSSCVYVSSITEPMYSSGRESTADWDPQSFA